MMGLVQMSFLLGENSSGSKSVKIPKEKIPSSNLTYPPSKGIFEVDDFPNFPFGGICSLEDVGTEAKANLMMPLRPFGIST